MTIHESATSTTSRQLPVLGQALLVSGLLGVLVGVLTLAYPADVPEAQWSYPFPTSVHWAVGAVLALAHLLTAAGFVGVLRAGPHRTSRAAAVGLWVAVAAYVGLGVCELVSGAIGSESNSSDAAVAVSTAFGIASTLTALGSVVAGVVIVRARVWTGPARWLVLASGLLMLLVVTPAIISENLELWTLALMLWSAVFVPLGRAVASSR